MAAHSLFDCDSLFSFRFRESQLLRVCVWCSVRVMSLLQLFCVCVSSVTFCDLCNPGVCFPVFFFRSPVIAFNSPLTCIVLDSARVCVCACVLPRLVGLTVSAPLSCHSICLSPRFRAIVGDRKRGGSSMVALDSIQSI